MKVTPELKENIRKFREQEKKCTFWANVRYMWRYYKQAKPLLESCGEVFIETTMYNSNLKKLFKRRGFKVRCSDRGVYVRVP